MMTTCLGELQDFEFCFVISSAFPSVEVSPLMLIALKPPASNWFLASSP